MNLCFPIAVLFLTLLLMHFACLTFIFLALSSVFILFSLQRPFCIPPAIQIFSFYHIQGCKMMSDHMFCSLSCPLLTLCSIFLVSMCFQSDLCNPRHPVAVAVIMNYIIVIKLVSLTTIIHLFVKSPLSLFKH